MRHAVFEGHAFRRFEIEPGVLEDAYIRVPVTVNPQPPHYDEERHYLKSYAILNNDKQSATVVYTVHDKPPRAAESTPQSLRPIIIERAAAPASPPVDLSPLERQMRELMEAVADLATANLRMRQELAEVELVVGVLAKISAKTQIYSADGKEITINIPPDQLRVFKKAMERAA
jgi:hypothetical protein